MDLTNGEGVDCVFEMLGGEHTKRSTRCTREFGRVILYGTATGERPEFDTFTMYSERRQRPRPVAEHHGQQCSSDVDGMESPTAVGPTRRAEAAKWATVLPMSRAADAFRLMLQRKNYGKIVLTL